MSSAPEVTLFIPTWNAGTEFPEILKSMQNQQVDRSYEILVIDSGSTDGTAEFLRDQDLRLIEIPNSEFNHGLTRDYGIREARGDIVVLVTQDARPADDQWLQRLIDCFADPRVAGAYSRQVVRPDANPFIKDRLERWTASALAPRVQFIDNLNDFDALPPLEKLARTSFDNVSSSVRRRIAMEIPFGNRRFGEDLDWAHRTLLAGYRIVYEPRSSVIHSHNNSTWYELKRVYLDHQNLYRLFRVQTVPNRWQLVRCTCGGALNLFRVVARDSTLGPLDRMWWWGKAVPYSLAQNLAQYLGAQSAAKGQDTRHFYRWCDRLLGGGV